ncbi:T9SS type A sorting domain-containing protein [Aquimarina sp. 2304DJ70-9]|uniref:T9SS type A sorting domain-containing protein n=1 Tax=Aquimarina penaris TaxID=3231044 RepID=UPI003461E617
MKKLTTNPGFLQKTMAKMGIASVFCISIFLFSSFNFMEENKINKDSFDNYLEETHGECRLTVDAGNDVSSCNNGDVTLTANVSGAAECCVQYDIVNTKHCKNNKRYVLWLSDGRNKTKYYRDGGLSWIENPDGTATLKGKVKNIRNRRDVLFVDVTYSGKTTDTPNGSPKNHWCNNENSQGWVYYTKVSGTIKKRNGSWSFNISERGPAFQLGKGANITEKNRRRLGASGWFNTTDNKYKIGDFNFNLGYCEEKTSEVSYLWSTGETTQTITVSEPGTYTVEVQDCENCVATDEVKVEKINLEVDAGEDQEVCEGDEITITATVSGESECTDCIAYGIENTYRCERDLYYVLWLKDDHRNRVRRFRNVDLVWQEFEDGTATLKGTVIENNSSQTTLEVDVTYSGRTVQTPPGSPKDHFCHEETAEGWVYYTGVSGTLTKTDGSWSFDISRMGPAFQLGNGANITEDEVGKYGASGWFNTTDNRYKRGDFNINIGECIDVVTSNEVTYLWSTGETTPSITVSPQENTTYTVTVEDCSGCTASDSVDVILSDPPQVDAGEDQDICKGEEITLVATVDGQGECEECVEYGVGDTDYCRGRHHQFVVFINDKGTRLWMRNVDLVWKENADGTATLKGNVFEYNSTNTTFVVDAVFSGRTVLPPEGSPKANLCQGADSSGWVYYTEISGTVTQVDGSLSYDISRRGEAFQVGAGANIFEYTANVFGGSGWFNLEGDPTSFGDFNINLECVKYEPKGIEYLWSTGETTQAINVAPEEDTTYEVTITGCTGCGEDTDIINVTVINCQGRSKTDVAIETTKVYPTLLSQSSTLHVDLYLNENQDVTTTLYDLTGRVIGSTTKTSINNNAQINIDLNQYKVHDGMYVLRIVGNNWVKTERIVISNK